MRVTLLVLLVFNCIAAVFLLSTTTRYGLASTEQTRKSTTNPSTAFPSQQAFNADKLQIIKPPTVSVLHTAHLSNTSAKAIPNAAAPPEDIEPSITSSLSAEQDKPTSAPQLTVKTNLTTKPEPSTPAIVEANIPKEAAPAIVVPAPLLCLKVNHLQEPEIKRLNEWVSKHIPQAKQQVKKIPFSNPVEDEANSAQKTWWVYISPSPNAQESEKRLQQLHRLDVQDAFVVRQAGPSQWAISLGLFREKSGALRLRKSLNQKGITQVAIEERLKEARVKTPNSKYIYSWQVNPLNEKEKKLLSTFIQSRFEKPNLLSCGS